MDMNTKAPTRGEGGNTARRQDDTDWTEHLDNDPDKIPRDFHIYMLGGFMINEWGDARAARGSETLRI